MTDLVMTIEKHSGFLWGQININNNLIIEKATSELKLMAKMKSLLLQWENLSEDQYTIRKDYI